MALITLADMRLIPEFSSTTKFSDSYLTSLISAAQATIERFCKRVFDLRVWTEYYDGSNQHDIPLRQYPVNVASTTIDASMNGLSLPQSTITVASNTSFATISGGPMAIQIGSGWTTVTYTAKSGSTDFTGCSGGSGTLVTGARVITPVIYSDFNGYYGQSPNGFPDSSIMPLGTSYTIVQNPSTASLSATQFNNGGILRRIGGSGGFAGYYDVRESMFSGKLAARRAPVWPRGEGNIKTYYVAGYATPPDDLKTACQLMVATLLRYASLGAPLSSESLGQYSYSLLQGGGGVDYPEIGSIQSILGGYREISL